MVLSSIGTLLGRRGRGRGEAMFVQIGRTDDDKTLVLASRRPA